MGNLHKMQRWPGFILCIGRTPKKVCYARALARVSRCPSPPLPLPLPLSISLSLCMCVCGYFLFCINAPQASLARQLACHRLPAPVSSAGRPAQQHAVSCPSPPVSVAPYSSATAAAATAAAADVNLLKKFRFLAFFCILDDGRSLYCAGGNRFHFMLSIEFKLFGK